MSFKNNICPRCASPLSEADVARMRREWRRGRIGTVLGMVFGLIGTGLGIYLGTNA